MYADVFWDLKILVSEIKYQKYQQYDIEGNSSFRMWKCEIFRARSHIQIFLSVSVLSDTVVYSAKVIKKGTALIVYVCRCILTLIPLGYFEDLSPLGGGGGGGDILAPPPPPSDLGNKWTDWLENWYCRKTSQVE